LRANVQPPVAGRNGRRRRAARSQHARNPARTHFPAKAPGSCGKEDAASRQGCREVCREMMGRANASRRGKFRWGGGGEHVHINMREKGGVGRVGGVEGHHTDSA
jgi:hypothetical protein